MSQKGVYCVTDMNEDMSKIIYGNKEEPWPYEYIINALQFFSMSSKNREKYIVNDFPEVLFHGKFADFITGNAQTAITEIFIEIISKGEVFDEWIEDEKLEDIGIEVLFKELHSFLTSMELKELFNNWEKIQTMSLIILNKLGWTEIDQIPEFSCKRMLDEWSYGDYTYQITQKS